MLRKSSLGRTQWRQFREVHSAAFEVVQKSVEESVIINEEAHFMKDQLIFLLWLMEVVRCMKDLVSTYISIVVDAGGEEYEEVTFTLQHLQDKLKLCFGNNVLALIVGINEEEILFIIRKQI